MSVSTQLFCIWALWIAFFLGWGGMLLSHGGDLHGYGRAVFPLTSEQRFEIEDGLSIRRYFTPDACFPGTLRDDFGRSERDPSASVYKVACFSWAGFSEAAAILALAAFLPGLLLLIFRKRVSAK